MGSIDEGLKALTKFEEIVEKLFGPWCTKKQADADAYADEKKLCTIRNNPDMEIVYVDGKMNARERTPEVLAYRAEQRRITDSIRQETNLENILEITADEVRRAENTSDMPVDDDWITRFFNIAKDVNSKEMQYIWAKILAGEIETPGSFSLKTLDTVKNMNKIDAENFQKILPVIVKDDGDLFIISNNDMLYKYGIDFSCILALDECGLINCRPYLGLNFVVTKNKYERLYTEKFLINVKGENDEEAKITIEIYPLTTIGGELYSILNHTSNIEYLTDLAKEFYEKNKEKVIVSIHKVTSINNSKVDFEDKALRIFSKDTLKGIVRNKVCRVK